MCGVSSGRWSRCVGACVSTQHQRRWAVRAGRHLTALPTNCDHGAWCSIAQCRQTLERTRTHCAAQPTWCQMPAPTPRDPGRAPIKVRHLPAGLLIRGSASPSVTDGRKTPPCTRQAIPSRAWGCWSRWGCVCGCDCPWGHSGSCCGPGQISTRHAAARCVRAQPGAI